MQSVVSDLCFANSDTGLQYAVGVMYPAMGIKV